MEEYDTKFLGSSLPNVTRTRRLVSLRHESISLSSSFVRDGERGLQYVCEDRFTATPDLATIDTCLGVNVKEDTNFTCVCTSIAEFT